MVPGRKWMFVLKVCTRFVCSCFVAPRVVLNGRSEEKVEEGSVVIFFFLFYFLKY